jgi:hypothetical protein
VSRLAQHLGRSAHVMAWVRDSSPLAIGDSVITSHRRQRALAGNSDATKPANGPAPTNRNESRDVSKERLKKPLLLSCGVASDLSERESQQTRAQKRETTRGQCQKSVGDQIAVAHVAPSDLNARPN